MATYCSVQDVRTALAPGVDVPNSGPDASKLPDWQIRDFIDAAEGVINAYVGARYVITPSEVEQTVPDSDPPTTEMVTVAPVPIRAWTRDIAAYYATLTFNRSKDIGEDDPIRLRFALVLQLLADVRDRKSILPLPPVPDDENATSGVAVFNLYEGTLFGPEDFNLTQDRGDSQHFIRSARWER
jgi:hypothetical protein